MIYLAMNLPNTGCDTINVQILDISPLSHQYSFPPLTHKSDLPSSVSYKSPRLAINHHTISYFITSYHTTTPQIHPFVAHNVHHPLPDTLGKTWRVFLLLAFSSLALRSHTTPWIPSTMIPQPSRSPGKIKVCHCHSFPSLRISDLTKRVCLGRLFLFLCLWLFLFLFFSCYILIPGNN